MAPTIDVDPARYRQHLGALAARNGLDVDIELPRRRHVVVGATRLHLLDWGEDGRPPVVFLHGGGLSAHTWDVVCLGLRTSYRCIAVDLRGHGESEWSPALDYAIDTHRADVVGLLDELGIERCPLVGMSLGGLVSLSIAEAEPERVSHLILVDVGPEPAREGVDRIQSFMYAEASFDDIDAAIEHALAFNPRRDPTLLRWSLERNLRRLPDGRYTWKYDRRPRETSAYLESTLASARRLADGAGRLQCPTLLVYGERSKVVSAASAQSFVDRVPRGRAVGVPDAGHSVQGDAPKLLIEHIEAFLRADASETP